MIRGGGLVDMEEVKWRCWWMDVVDIDVVVGMVVVEDDALQMSSAFRNGLISCIFASPLFSPV